MKKIALTKSKFALIDDKDFDFLMQWKWCFSGGYAVRRRKKTEYSTTEKSQFIHMHRVINNTPAGLLTDHIDRDKLNNQRCNLRNATDTQNVINKTSGNRKSKYRGVTMPKRNGGTQKYIAQIVSNKKYYLLGEFYTEVDAAKAYNKAAAELHGEYAYLNAIIEGE